MTTIFTSRFNLFLIVLLMLSDSVFATVWTTTKDGNWNSNSTWISGTVPTFDWSGPMDTVIINHSVNLNTNVQALYAVIIINSGKILSNTGHDLTIGSNAKMVNNGSLAVKNLTLDWSANSIENNATISVNSAFVINNGTLNNAGSMTITGSTTNAGTLNNSGTFSTQSITNNSSLTNSGSISTTGAFTNNYSSTTSNSGTLTVGTSFTNNNTFSNSGTISTGSDFTNNWSSTFTSSATGNLSIAGALTNNSTFSSAGTASVTGSVLNNYSSSITNTGNMSVGGSLTNNNSISSSDSLLIAGAVLNNYSSTISNTGNMSVGGNVTNYNSIVNSGELLVSGTVANSGASTITGTGTLCNPDGATDPTNGSSSGVDNTICGGESSNLPVELINFKARFEGELIQINWATASETNNNFFDILQSIDGINFYKIGMVKGYVSTSLLHNYEFTIKEKSKNAMYFRLRQVDFDGKYNYSKIIIVKSRIEKEIYIFPNPIKSGEVLSLQLSENSPSSIKIFSAGGIAIYSAFVPDSAFRIETTGLSNGIYLVQIIQNQVITTRKVHITD